IAKGAVHRDGKVRSACAQVAVSLAKCIGKSPIGSLIPSAVSGAYRKALETALEEVDESVRHVATRFLHGQEPAAGAEAEDDDPERFLTTGDITLPKNWEKKCKHEKWKI
ncbi:hypothetical protein KIPB_016597, partial [Kipferlia bialata]